MFLIVMLSHFEIILEKHGTISQIIFSASIYLEAELTNEAEDVSNGGHEDNQHVVEGQDCCSNQHVAGPAELSAAKQQCGDGGSDLREKRKKECGHLSLWFHNAQ